MRILVTNDDGVQAPGLLALCGSLARVGTVFVVAPERPRSASGHAVTLHKPLRLSETTLADGTAAWSASGTPSDCVTLGKDIVCEGDVDVVVSGINDGANLGWDLTYSGTVMGAMEGTILGLPSVAVSVACRRDAVDFGPAAEFAATIVRQVANHGLQEGVLLNVNVPPVPMAAIRGVCVTRQGRREYIDRVERRVDPSGRPYYWLSGVLKESAPDEGTDVWAVQENMVSVTPVHLDMTAAGAMEYVRGWDLYGGWGGT